MKNKVCYFVLLSLLLSGCASAGGQNTGSQNVQTDTPAPQESSKPDEVPKNVFKNDTTIEETVLWDDGSVIITASELNFSNYSADLKLKFENNTDKALNFVSGSIGYSSNTINRYMTSEMYVNESVDAGMKANKTISISLNELQALGINEIAEIGIGFMITDDDHNDYARTGALLIPTSASDSYDPDTDTYLESLQDGSFAALGNAEVHDIFTDVAYSNSRIHLDSAAVVSNSSGDTVILLEMTNTSEETVIVRYGSVSADNVVICSSNWTNDTIAPHKTAITMLDLSNMISEEYASAIGLGSDCSYTVDITLMDEEYKITDNVTTAELGPAYAGEFNTDGDVLYDQNGFTVISKGLANDPSSYSEDKHALFLVINNNGKPAYANIDYKSVSVNGYMTDFICYTMEVPPHKAALLDLELMSRSLKENDVSGIESITELKCKLQLAQDTYYNYIDQPSLSVSYTH